MKRKVTLYMGDIKRVKKAKAIHRISVVDQVSEAIKQNILDHVWNVGDKIPSESELADEFEVNRLSVRMALQKLSTLGLIETRVGEGSFVTKFSPKPFFSELAAVYHDKDRYQDVVQLRNLLEGESMRLAHLNANDEDLKKLKECLDSYYNATDIYNKDIDNREYLENLVDADLAFHYEIIKISHNYLYVAVYQVVQELVRDHIKQLLYKRTHDRKRAGYPAKLEDDTHTKMYQSILNGDQEEARRSREETLGIVQVHGLDYFESGNDSI